MKHKLKWLIGLLLIPMVLWASANVEIVATTGQSIQLIIGSTTEVTIDANGLKIEESLAMKEVSTPSSPSAGYQKLFFDTSDNKAKRVDSSGTVSTLGGGSPNFDQVYDVFNADSKGTGDFNTGNNATLLGAGSIVGTLGESSTPAYLLDASDASVFTYTAGASDETNDYFCTEALTIPQGLQNSGASRQDILHKFWYWSEVSESVLIKAYCVDDAVEQAHLSTTPSLANVDFLYGDNDGVKDLDEGVEFNNGLGVVFSYPTTCKSTRLCFHIQGDIPTGEEIVFNKITTGVMPVNRVETLLTDEWSTCTVNQTGWTSTTVTAKCRREGADLHVKGLLGDVPVGGAAVASFSIPAVCGADGASACTIATSKLNDQSGLTNRVGTLNRIESGQYPNASNMEFPLHVDAAVNNFIYVSAQVSASHVYDKDIGSTITNQDGPFEFIVPIQSWKASNKAIAVTGSQHMAGHFGSVTWTEDNGCAWTVTSTTYADMGSDTTCDDNVRTKDGLYNTSDVSIGHADGRKPQITFSKLPAGRYVVTGIGDHKKDATATNSYIGFRWTDGTNHSSPSSTYCDSSQSCVQNSVIGEFNYTTEQTDVTFEIQGASDSGAVSMYMSDGSILFGYQINVKYFPPDTLVGKGVNYMLPTIDVGGDYHMEGFNNGSESITANTTDVTFTETVDNLNAWDGNTLTAPYSGTYTFTGSVYVTASSAWAIDAYKGSTRLKRVGYDAGASDTQKAFHGQIYLLEGEEFSLRLDASKTLDNAVDRYHHISIDGHRDEGAKSYAHIISQPTCVIEERKQGNGGGTAANTEYDRVLNTMKGNCPDITLTNGTTGIDGTNDEVTLGAAGTYLLEWSSPVYSVSQHQSYLQTGGAIIDGCVGASGYGHLASVVFDRSVGSCEITISASTPIKLVQWVTGAVASTGLGLTTYAGTNNAATYDVYANLKITRKR